ncbi:MAG: antibiotic biosynthesis monooxygenase family protein [Roseibium sp.]
MFVALVDFRVEPSKQSGALNTLLADVELVTTMPGCQTFRPYCDPSQKGHVGVVHEWDSEDAFNGYLGSEEFKRMGADLRPLMVSVPSSRRYSATLLQMPG